VEPEQPPLLATMAGDGLFQLRFPAHWAIWQAFIFPSGVLDTPSATQLDTGAHQ
jgi:hypothetical protein